MDSTRWDRIQSLFHKAADLPQGEQHAYLQSACANDAALLADVLAMLREDSHQSSMLDQSVAGVASDLLDADSSPLAGREFGPYRLIRILGEGGMGVVYLAERKDLRSSVAIKVLRDAWLSPARR